MSDLLTTAEAATRLGISPASIRWAIKDERLTPFRKAGRDWLIDAAEVERYAQERKPWRGSRRYE